MSDAVRIALELLRATGEIVMPTAAPVAAPVSTGQRMVRIPPKNVPAPAPAPVAAPVVREYKPVPLEVAKVFRNKMHEARNIKDRDNRQRAEIEAISQVLSVMGMSYRYGDPPGLQLYTAVYETDLAFKREAGEFSYESKPVNPTVNGWVSGIPMSPALIVARDLYVRNQNSMEFIIDLEKVENAEDLISVLQAHEQEGIPSTCTDKQALIIRDEILRVERGLVNQRSEQLVKMGML